MTTTLNLLLSVVLTLYMSTITHSRKHVGKAYIDYADFGAGLVYVRTCDGRPLPVYSDPNLTVELPNPFLTDKRGHFTYYTQDYAAANVEVRNGRAVVFSLRSCDDTVVFK